MTKRIIFGANDFVVEPIGLLHLSAIAKQEGWEPKIVLIKNYNFEKLDNIIKEFKPDVFGFSLSTGSHVQVFNYFDELKKRQGNLTTLLGGPHPTFFPKESSKHVDYVVLSEGFNSLRKILRGEVSKGIVHLTKQEEFPLPDREEFYRNHPHYVKSYIKSIITKTGCPYSCTYCFNSSTLDSIKSDLTSQQTGEMGAILGNSKKLFPNSKRPVTGILDEISEIKRISPETKMIYFQDDVFGLDVEWVKEFAKKNPSEGFPFHAQMRFEFADPKISKNRERMEFIKQAGCIGLTFAIESSNAIIRQEVLDRHMKEELMFDVFSYLRDIGYEKIRTEQMLGFPYGATSKKTKVNLEADLETLELNVKLREATGFPTLAWASIFVPYNGTKIGDYCKKYGFYEGGNDDVPESFFHRSVLNFPKEWTGPSLTSDKKYLWLSESDKKTYKNRLQILRNHFQDWTEIKNGHELAKKVLEKEGSDYKFTPEVKDFSFVLSTERKRHIYDHILYDIV